MNYVRENIEAMAGYVPGEQPKEGEAVKLNTNENPYRASEKAYDAIRAVADKGLSRYPNAVGAAFREAAANVYGVEPDWVMCGNGSDDILTILTRTFVGENQILRLPYPSYILYKSLAEIQGARSEEVFFNDDWSLPDYFAQKPATTATTVPADAFFKSWTLPNDTDPTITTSLLMSAQPVTNFIPAGATNPTIPAGTPSYVKEVRPTDPTAATGGTWSREIGYFTLPASTTTQTEGGTSVTTLPATGKITFWPQSTMTSVDGTTWTTEQPTGQTPTMREYTYTMYGNVMLLTGADKSTLTYYTTTVIAQ